MKIDLKKTIPILTITILLISTIAFIGIPVSASPDVITPADAEIDADTYKTGAYTDPPAIVIAESAAGEIGTGTIILNVSEGFEFRTTPEPDVAVTGAGELAATFTSITTTQITITVTKASSTAVNTLTIGGTTAIGVRPLQGTPLAEGDIVMDDASTSTIAGVTPGTTSFGLLTEVPGALHHFTMTGYPSTCIAEIPWTTPDNDVTVKVYDQYGNLKTNYLGTVHWTSTDTAATLPADHIFTSGDAGSYTFSGSGFTLATVGTQTITVTDTVATDISLTSSPITVSAFATISPSLVAGGKKLWFDITVTNIVSEASIYKAEITYPAWTFKDVVAPTGWVIDDHTGNTVTFRATGGYEISPDASAVFKFKMTTADPGSTMDYGWTIKCWDTSEIDYTETPDVTVDVEAPDVAVSAPTVDYYSVGAGNYIWLNLTVTDDIEATPDVYMNATDLFKFLKVEHTAGTAIYKFCYVNKTVVPDGPLAVWFNVTDYVGNWYEFTDSIPAGFPTKLSAYVDKTVDNTAPFILIDVEEATLVGSTFYIGKDVTSITINVTVADYGLEDIGPLTGIYVNGTLQTGWTFSSTGKTYKGYPVWQHIQTGFSTPLKDNLWILYVNTTDTARPSNHTSEMEVRISRDLESPYEIGFTSAEPICGGVIIRGLYAEDLVGVKDYTLYLNGTVTLATITEADLKSTLWTGNAFNRIVVLDLSAYAGDFVNITVIAEDFGLNPSDEIVLFTGVVPEGEWYPVVLYKGWNLISLPLIPNSTASADVLSLILKQGAIGVSHVYEYDQNTDTWIVDPATIEDGKGYWFYMKNYDVLIVSGSKMPPGGGIPPTYTLTKGWVLAGFKSTADMKVSDYLASVRNASYFKIIYIWNADVQSWGILNRDEAADEFTPGQGFWILMYEEEVLVPPTA